MALTLCKSSEVTKLLSAQILRQALADSRRPSYMVEAVEFAMSEWCEFLCWSAEIDWLQYRRGIANKIEKAFKEMKPHRIKKQYLIKILKV